MRKYFLVLLAHLLAFVAAAPSVAALSVTLSSSLPSAQSVGTEVIWIATATGDVGSLVYRYEVSRDGTAWRMLSDFYESPQFAWTSIEEGEYQIRTTVANLGTEEWGVAIEAFEITPLASLTPVLAATQHPLVALYAAPPCPARERVRVQFRPSSSSDDWRNTDWRRCRFGRSINFLVAGMAPERMYDIRQQNRGSDGIENGEVYLFTTGTPDVEMAASFASVPLQPTSYGDAGLLLLSLASIPSGGLPAALDAQGNLVWYYKTPHTENGLARLMRPGTGGTMLLQDTDPMLGKQLLREVDLAGNIVWQTSVTAVNMQLTARGEDNISLFHHDWIELPDGRTAVLGYIERTLVDIQGPGPVNVVGDNIIVLDANGRVVWTWNAFDHLDTSRKALGDAKCFPDGRTGCFTVFSAEANDWTHANSLDYVPSSGSLLLSIRHQNWVAKIDYANGEGSGDVLWRLGQDGDFRIFANAGPWPWFSYQHDAEMENGLLTLYDNGNTRHESLGTGNSRGQGYLLLEPLKIALLRFNIDLGHYSPFLCSAQRLPNGDYSFGSGALPDDTGNPNRTQITEALPSGQTNYLTQVESLAYRTFRILSLHDPFGSL